MERTEESLKKVVNESIESYYQDLIEIFSSPEKMEEINADISKEPSLGIKNGDEVIIPILKGLNELKAVIFSDGNITKEDIPNIDHLFTALYHYGLKNGVDVMEGIDEDAPEELKELEMDLFILLSNLSKIKKQVLEQE